MLVGTLFAPNELFAYFAWVARFVGPVFLLYQLLLFIDFGYTLNAGLVAKDDRQDLFFGCRNDSGNLYKALNLILAALLLIGSLVVLGAFYALWPAADGCAFNPLAITSEIESLSLY